MYFDSSVLLAYFRLRNESWCCVNRCLKVPSVRPMKFLLIVSSVVVICAL